MDASYVCVDLGVMHLLNEINCKQLEILLFPLEILKLYYQTPFMTLAIIVINFCCLCRCLSDFIFV